MIVEFSIINGWLIVTHRNEWGYVTEVFLLSDTFKPNTYRRKWYQDEFTIEKWHRLANKWAFDHDPRYPQTSDQELEDS